MNRDVDYLLEDFMNLIQACEHNNVTFDSLEGVTLSECRDTVNWFFANEGRSKAEIERLWAGEDQLTCS